MQSPTLTDFINYENPRLISRYQKDFPNADMPAVEALKEFMKFVWLCQQYKAEKKQNPLNPELDFSCAIHVEMSDIDNMWHTFLLFTKDYQHFCQVYLNGEFFHHEPSPEQNEVSDERYQQELSLYLSYIYDKLGEETVIKWFKE